jgi:hypothetical protein
MESVCFETDLCMHVCVCPCVSSLLLPPGPGLGLGCAFVGWASGLESVSGGSIRAVSSLTLILCNLVSSVFSLSFFLHLLSMPCPDLECIASVAFFFVPELGSLLFYVLIGRG